MRIHWRSAAGILATASVLSLFCLLPSGAQEAPSPPAAAAPPAPPAAASPATPPATPPRQADAAPTPEERSEGEELPADERVSADNNLSFPVDI